MTVKQDADGRRYVAVEVEVPGTRDEVWRAVATGPGVSSWFVPTELEPRVGGEVVSRFGPGMEAVARITAWDPPGSFSAESPGAAPGAPPLATQWIVEPRSDEACTVRVVHSMVADGALWDAQLAGAEAGWPAFFRILRAYLTHFRDQHGATLQLMALSELPVRRAWRRLAEGLGLARAAVGEQRATTDGAPPLAGWVEAAGGRERPPELLLRVDQPAPGLAHLFGLQMGPQALLMLRFVFFGPSAAETAARAEPVWQAWVERRFPRPAGTGEAGPPLE